MNYCTKDTKFDKAFQYYSNFDPELFSGTLNKIGAMKPMEHVLRGYILK